jgi:hypothetical protein
VEMGMMISWNSSWRNESSSVGKCEVLVDGNDDDTMTKLGCPIDVLSVINYLNATINKDSSSSWSMYLWLMWRAKDKNGSHPIVTTWFDLPAHYLTLQWVTRAFTEIVSSCNCNYIIDGCDSTALCGGQFQCLNTTCYNGTIASLYDETECNGECPSLLSSRISSTIESEEYFEDPNNTCCTLDALDCAGYCQVGIVIRIQPMFNDCAGVCGGSHIINPCGICTKTDPTGSSCFNSRQLIIQTHHSDGNVYLQFNYSDSLETSASILLMNTGIFDLTISLYLSSSPSFYPILTFPSSIHLAALSNISIFINASFDGLSGKSS